MTSNTLFKAKVQSLTITIPVFLFLAACHDNGPRDKPYISFKDIPGENRIEVLYDEQLFTAYIYPDELAKPVLFPVNSANNNPVTRGYPLDPRPGERSDHPHQVGHWFNYGDVNGLDFWNNRGNIPEEEKDRYGYIEHSDLLRMDSGKGKGELVVSALWKNYRDDTILTENTTFVFSSQEDTRIIDRVTTLTAGDEDVLFRDNKEGMVAVRVARELELPGDNPEQVTGSDGSIVEAGPDYQEGITGNYLSSRGQEGHDVWGKRAEWVVLSGIIDGNDVALAIIDHPDNPGYPAYWHARGYGLFSANPLGQEVFSEGREALNFNLPAGESVTFRYRILVHSGSSLSADEINYYADDFGRHIL
ncbi:MAG: PmoA family protein [Bacteroidales bacterium]